MKTKTIDIREATISQLNWLVAKREGLHLDFLDGKPIQWVKTQEGEEPHHIPDYANDSALAGPLIEREKIVLFTGSTEVEGRFDDWAAFVGGVSICAFMGSGGFGQEPDGRGPTHTIAAMRAFASMESGDLVEIPENLE